MIIEKLDEHSDYRFHLFVRPKDTKAEIWDGARSGLQAAQDVFNADEVSLAIRGNIWGVLADCVTFRPEM